MNYSEIQTHLTECGYKVSVFPYGSAGNDSFTVELEINNYLVTLIHIAVPELTQMPRFLLGDPSALPRLAHTTIHAEKRYASICVNVPDAVSVNYERPELAFEESLTRHIALLTNALSDSEWNNSELLRVV